MKQHLTKNREDILNLVLSSNKPINAKSLKEHVLFDLSTVYRALDFLELNNYISSFNIENEKFYFKENSGNFVLCDECKTIDALPNDIIKENTKKICKKTGFSFISQLFLFRGKCPDCSKERIK